MNKGTSRVGAGCLAIVAALSVAACAGEEGWRDEAHARVERTDDGFRAFVETSDGERLATLDYLRDDAQARWATMGHPSLSQALRVSLPDERATGDLALTLWRATERASAGPAVPAAVTTARPSEIFYTRKPPEGPTCSHYRACEAFYGGWACVEINGDCSGRTWIEL